MANFNFVETDIDGEGKRRRLIVDAGEHVPLADEKCTVPRKTIVEYDDRTIGPFTVMQLLKAIQTVVRT